MAEMKNASWRELLKDVVAVEVDFSTRHRLPGFLSESYTGDGVQYTGDVGIPQITAAPTPRITDAASLYTLGVAYSIAPEKVEPFLAEAGPSYPPYSPTTDPGKASTPVSMKSSGFKPPRTRFHSSSGCSARVPTT